MKFDSVGAVIAAASKKDAVPLLKVGSIPIVRRIVLTLQQVGVFPIVVVTGTEELEVTRQACLHIGLSYQKVWDMNNWLKRALGYTVVTRQHGGKNSGSTCLTDKGQQLMYAFQHYENEVRGFARQRYNKLFRENGSIE